MEQQSVGDLTVKLEPAWTVYDRRTGHVFLKVSKGYYTPPWWRRKLWEILFGVRIEINAQDKEISCEYKVH